MKKINWKLPAGIVIAIVIISQAVEFKKLDAARANEEETFDAKDYAMDYWQDKMPETIGQAAKLLPLLSQLEETPEQALEKANKVGISDSRYFMVSDTGTIREIKENNLVIQLNDNRKVKLATAFIFGNTVRNACSNIAIGSFKNMMHYNLVSIELNNIIKEQVVPELNNQAQVGKKLAFTGAMEVDKSEMELDSLRIIPVKVNYKINR